MNFYIFFVVFLLVKASQAVPTSHKYEHILEDIDPKNLVQIGNATYYFSEPDIHVSYGDAFQLCSGMNMVLTSFPYEEQWLKVKKYLIEKGLGETRFWTSGENIAWQWYWTSIWQQILYFDWSIGEPSGWAYIHIVAKDGWKSSSGQNAALMCEY